MDSFIVPHHNADKRLTTLTKLFINSQGSEWATNKIEQSL